jgi:hypothetical protein
MKLHRQISTLALLACCLAAASPSLLLTPTALGSIAIGMTPAKIAAAAKAKFLPENGKRFTNSECVYGKIAGNSGAVFMLAKGTLVRIDVSSGPARTAQGIGIGDSVAKVKQAYRGRYATSPGKYVAKNTEFEITSGGNARLLIITDGKVVTGLRAGRIPEVYLVEGCS